MSFTRATRAWGTSGWVWPAIAFITHYLYQFKLYSNLLIL
jgi:hypothetical protein